jgi:alkanesulfonate monooxygenase SsuD/methylene tetrahydromethanopterin reductase-like flavin-dependent oxidoreductase (luciferase family)
MPLIRGETAAFNGEEYRVNGVKLDVPGAAAVPVVVAALGPVMLRLAGELADGTNTWMVGPKTMESHIIKRLRDGASAAGRPDPRVVGGFPVILTNKPDAAREKIAQNLTIYGQLPSYRAMLDREGAAGPADIALAGDENLLRGEIARLASIGVTDFNAAIMDVEDGAYARTLEFLASIKVD